MRTRAVPQRLPGGGHQVNLIVGHSHLFDQAIGGGGEQLTEDEVEMADLLDARLALVEQGVDATADVAWKRK